MPHVRLLLLDGKENLRSISLSNASWGIDGLGWGDLALVDAGDHQVTLTTFSEQVTLLPVTITAQSAVLRIKQKGGGQWRCSVFDTMQQALGVPVQQQQPNAQQAPHPVHLRAAAHGLNPRLHFRDL